MNKCISMLVMPKTNTLIASSLNNTNNSKSTSIGVQTGVTNQQSKNRNQGLKNPTTEINGVSTIALDYTNNKTNSKTKTLATLGNGNIQIADKDNSETKMLNTDIANNRVDIYNISSNKGLKGELDTRLVSKDGRNKIKEDLDRSKRLGGAIVDVATKESIKITDTFNHISDVQKDLDVQKALSLKDNGKLIEILDDKNRDKYTQKQRDNALNEYAQIYANTYDVTIESAKLAVSTKMGSTYTNQQNTSSKISIDNTKNSGALDTADTMGHEVAHVRQNQGQTRLRETKRLQEEYSDTFGEYSADGMEFSSSTYNSLNLNTDKASNPIRAINNKDLKVLSNNTSAYLKDKGKANSGNGRMDDRRLTQQEVNYIKTVAKDYASQTTVENLVGRESKMDESTAKALLATAALYYNDKETYEKTNDDLKYVSASRFTLKQIQDAGAYLQTSSEGKKFYDMYDEGNMRNQDMFSSTQAQFNNPNHTPDISIGLEDNSLMFVPATRVAPKVINATAIVGRSTASKVDDVILNSGIKADNLIQNKVVPAVKDGYYRTANTVIDPENIKKGKDFLDGFGANTPRLDNLSHTTGLITKKIIQGAE